MTRRRTDGLAVLARLKRHDMEDVASDIARIDRALARIEADRRALLTQLDERGDPEAVESTRVLSAFIRNVSETIHRKDAQAERQKRDSAEVRDRLQALFADAKRIDLLRRRRSDARRRLADEKEAAAQNEGFLSIWLEDQDSA
ncbi:hypothetical protein DU478_14840 [Thalassococcus profundi]|uniref:Flagellar FliJ protein n=1 Tax=Thalassococcus profundi TaxID=2282382 RepID=A0A369TJG9_9RHOB|nr:hypothetical protein [Thalassococcus profundi]RDD65443.1 hypothetical protein DU478_14840 [Thalassococcus profundi]